MTLRDWTDPGDSKKRLIFLVIVWLGHAGIGTAQVSDAAQGAADGEAAADSLRGPGGYIAIMGAGGLLSGAVNRSRVSSGRDLATEAGIYGAIGIAGGIVIGLLSSDLPDELSEGIADRPDDYRMSFEQEYRQRYRSDALIRGILGGLVAGVAYALTAGAGNDRLDDGPSYTLISARVRF